MSDSPLDLLARQIDDAAAGAASAAYLEHLAGRREADFWALPQELQGHVVLVGCDIADEARNAFAEAVDAEPDVLADVWRFAAARFQAHVDHLLLTASRSGGRA